MRILGQPCEFYRLAAVMHVELTRGELVAAVDLAPHAELARFPLLPMLALGLAVLEPAADGDEVYICARY